MMRFAVCLVAAISIVISLKNVTAFGNEWTEIKDKHFVVQFTDSIEEYEARKVLREAEKYYRRIGNLIGYSRYSDFWTWDERVKIIIYPDQESFVRETGQPDWSTGFADREKFLYESRSIVTYLHEDKLFEGILPHEISHLVLKDYLGFKKLVPLWFEEGVAQYQEKDKKRKADGLMRSLVKRGHFIPLKTLARWDIRTEKDPVKVQTFYAQSVSIIDFLIKRYGRQSFIHLCKGLKDGKSFQAALRSAYTNSIDSIYELEKKWLKHLK